MVAVVQGRSPSDCARLDSRNCKSTQGRRLDLRSFIHVSAIKGGNQQAVVVEFRSIGFKKSDIKAEGDFSSHGVDSDLFNPMLP